MSNIITSPRTTFDLAALWDHPEIIEAGIEWQIWRNKFGIKEVNELIPQAFLKWIF